MHTWSTTRIRWMYFGRAAIKEVKSTSYTHLLGTPEIEKNELAILERPGAIFMQFLMRN